MSGLIELSEKLVGGLKKEVFDRFLQRVKAHIKKLCDTEHIPYLDDRSLESFVLESIKRGEELHNLTTQDDLLEYVTICALLGFGFEEDPFYTSLNVFIDNTPGKEIAIDVSDAFVMAKWYFNKFAAYNSQRVCTKLMHMREEYIGRYRSLKKIETGRWMEVLERYLKKGDPILKEPMVRERFKAVYGGLETYGLQEAGSVMVYTLLASRFGIGMDKDPRYADLFRQVLSAEGMSESQKVLRLIDTAKLFCPDAK